MAGQDADVVDPFFDSEEDEAPVDMEVVFEAMKHVPLPDLYYAEPDDPMAAEPEPPPALMGAPRSKELSATTKAVLKGTAGTGEAGPAKKKGVSKARGILKQVKVVGQGRETNSKSSTRQPLKVEGNTIATAAKVAAEVAPHVVTAGIVAEAGPRPDFSLWSVEDDLLLKNAMEAGAAMEALAKGAMRFSRRFTVRELRERWRALLYDPEIAAQAATRMVEAEVALSNLPLKSKGFNEPRNSQTLARKRRSNSIRSLYYKKRKRLAAEKHVSESQLLDNGMEGIFVTTDGMVDEIHGERGVRSLLVPLDMMALGTVDPGLLGGIVSPKEGTTLDFEDRTFSHMVSLLAAGGVGAVIGALPAATIMDTAEDDHNLSGSMSPGGEGLSRFDGLYTTEGAQPDDHEEADFGQAESEVGQVIPVQGGEQVHALCESPAAERVGIDAGACVAGYHSPEIEEKTETMEEANHAWQPPADTGIPLRKGEEENAGHGKEDNCGPHVSGHFDVDQHSGPSLVSPASNRLQDTLPAEHMCKMESSKTPNVEGMGHILEAKDLPHKISLTTNSTTSEGRYLLESDLTEAVNSEEFDANVRLASDCTLKKSPSLVVVEGQVSDKDPWLVRDAEETEDRVGVAGEGDESHGGDMHDTNSQEEFEEDVDGDDGLFAADMADRSLPFDSSIDLDHCDPGDSGEIRKAGVDPSLGQILCTLNTQDTEIPTLDETLPFPTLLSPVSSPSEQGEGEEKEGIEGMKCTTMDHIVDTPISPVGFHVNEELESQGMLQVKIEPGSMELSTLPAIGATKFGTKFKERGAVQMSSSSIKGERFWDHQLTAAGQESPVARTLYQPPSLISAGTSPVTVRVSSPHGVSGGRPNEEEEEEGTPALSPNAGHQFPESVVALNATSHSSDLSRSQGDSPTDSSRMEPMPPYIAAQMALHGVDCGVSSMTYDPLMTQELVGASTGMGALRSGAETPSGEEDIESEAEMARFSDVETMILNMDLDPGVDDEFSARAESRRMYRQHRRSLVRLEQGGGAAMQRALNHRKALAILYGHHLRYYMTKTEVSMGRMTQDNTVDIDLGKEGRANKVSRQQALMKLKEDGVFYLRNLGRRSLTVNNNVVETGQRAILGSNCLIEVGGMRFIFEINKKLVKQRLERL